MRGFRVEHAVRLDSDSCRLKLLKLYEAIIVIKAS